MRLIDADKLMENIVNTPSYADKVIAWQPLPEPYEEEQE